MAKQSDDRKVQRKKLDSMEFTIKGRMLFPNLIRPVADDRGKSKYSMQFMWSDKDKKNQAQLERLKTAIMDHKNEWYPDHPNFVHPIKHYDKTTKKDGTKHPTYLKGHYWMNLGNNREYPPTVFDHNKNHVKDGAELTNGRNCLVVVKIFPYDVSGNIGISASMKAVVLLPGGEVPFGGEPVDAEELFANIGDDIKEYVEESEENIAKEIQF